MSKKWPGGIITPTPATPTGPYQTGAAPGIWTLSQQAFWKKQGLWPIAGNVAPAWALWAGGMTSNNAYIVYANLNTTGNFSLWGNLTTSPTSGGVGLSSTTRGVFCGGSVSGPSSVMQYVTLSSTGNATFFGNLASTTGANNGVAGVSSPTRGVIMGGNDNAVGRTNNMSYITTATTGNTTFFGDLTQQVLRRLEKQVRPELRTQSLTAPR